MFRVLLLALVAMSFVVTEASSTSTPRKLQPRIFNGKSARRDQFPYQVGFHIPVNDHTNETCGGALISQRFVISAGSCFFDLEPDDPVLTTRNFIAFFGGFKKFSLNEEGHIHLEISPENVMIHPDYNIFKMAHNIALVKTPKEIPLNNFIKVINLPPKNLNHLSLIGQKVTTSGWGRLGNVKEAQELQYMVAKIVPYEECINPEDSEYSNESKICIHGPKKGSCKGDSGDPNVITTVDGREILIGTFSHLAFGQFTCEGGRQLVLARITYYLQWIHDKTGISI